MSYSLIFDLSERQTVIIKSESQESLSFQCSRALALTQRDIHIEQCWYTPCLFFQLSRGACVTGAGGPAFSHRMEKCHNDRPLFHRLSWPSHKAAFERLNVSAHKPVSLCVCVCGMRGGIPETLVFFTRRTIKFANISVFSTLCSLFFGPCGFFYPFVNQHKMK